MEDDADDDVVVLDSGQPQRPPPIRKLTEYEQLLLETAHPDAKVFAGHLIDAVIDEIALEGLDGITVQALKIRLEQRPNFEMEGFEDVANAIWNQLKQSKCLRFYSLPKERPDLIKYNWEDFRDDRGNAYEPLHAPEDIYPYYPVEDKTRGIRGSCQHYATRKDISHIVRRATYLESVKMFGNRLVIVGIQRVREKALFGVNYKRYKNLSIVQYCSMERVGRARHSGEITRGKISFTCMKIPPKTLFYQRKLLLAAGLVTKQSTSIKFANNRCPAGITVFHLPRFYKRIESKAALNTRTVFSFLNQSPTKSITTEFITSTYGKHMLRNLQTQFADLLELAWENVVQSEVELALEGKSAKKNKMRSVRVLRLKVKDIAMQNLVIRKVLEGESAEDIDTTDTAEQEEDEKVSCKSANSFAAAQILRPRQHFFSRTDSHRMFCALVRAGVKGLTQKDLTFLQTTPLETRSAMRYLNRLKVCKEGVVKKHKQKAFSYTLSKFAGKERAINFVLQESYHKVLMEMASLRQAMVLKQANKQKRKQTRRKHHHNRDQIDDNVEEDMEDVTELNVVEEVNLFSEEENIEDTENLVASVSTLVQNVTIPAQQAQDSSPQKISPRKSPNKTKLLEKSISIPKPSLVLVQSGRNVEDHLSVSNLSNESSELLLRSRTETMEASETASVPSPGKPHLVAVISTQERCQTVEHAASEDISIPTSNDQQIDDPFLSNESLDSDSELSYSASQEELDREEVEVEAMNQVDRNRRGDLIDEELRSKMTRQRVDWNPHDDRFILLAFIASALFIPKYNFTRVFIFNSTQIRDLLVRKTDGKSCKTSLAIRRRLHFLMNQKAYYEIYLGLIGAALRDQVLYENYIKDHLHPPQLRIYYNPPLLALETAINYLNQKFNSEEYVVTDTRGSLIGVDTLLFIRQLKRLDFFWKAMMFVIFCPMGESSRERRRFRIFWQTLIMKKEDEREERDDLSATSSSDSELDEVQPPQLVRSVDAPKHSVSYDRADLFEIGDEAEDVESESPLVGETNNDEDENGEEGDEKPHKYESSSEEEDSEDEKHRQEDHELEYCFKYLKFFVKQCRMMFGDRYVLSDVNKNGFALVSFDMSATSSNVCFSVRECQSESEIRLWTARSLVLDLVFSADLSRSLERSVLNYVDVPVERASKSLRRARVLIANKKTRRLGISKLVLRQLIAGLSSDSFDETLDFLNYIDEASDVDSSACISSGILMGIVELTDYFSSCFTITESIFTLNDEWVPVYDDLMDEGDIATKNSKKRKHQDSSDSMSPSYKRCRITEDEEEKIEGLIECLEEMEKDVLIPKPRKNVGLEEGEHHISSSTNALRLLRIRLNEAGLQMPRKQFTGFVERDFFAINLPDLKFIFPQKTGLNHKVVGTSHPFSQDFLKDLRSTLVELVYHHVARTSVPVMTQNISKYVGKYAILFEVISCVGALGISGQLLATKFERGSLTKGLRFLIDSKLIFSVGVTHRRFVSFNNMQQWLIPIHHQVGHKKLGHVVMRPWITILGGISWSAINRIFIALLGQLQRPAVLFDELSESLRPTLSNVEVTVLIEALVKIKYLTVYKLRESETTAFSKHPQDKLEFEFHVDTLVDTANVYVAVSPYTTFLHAQLQEAIVEASKWRSEKPKAPATT